MLIEFNWSFEFFDAITDNLWDHFECDSSILDLLEQYFDEFRSIIFQILTEMNSLSLFCVDGIPSFVQEFQEEPDDLIYIDSLII